MDLKKILICLLLILLTSSRVNKNYPDALRCGNDQYPGQLYILHNVRDGSAYYDQI